tara:strand:+ start:1554 stop:7655 length:6102 start_codon:yes stop_codon:yes gene_type:complete
MSSIIFQDVNTIEYTSIKFDYLAIDTDDILEQQENERLLVHQNGSRFSMIVLDDGLFLNTTREDAQDQQAKNYALYADGNAYFTGTLTASKINILDTDISDSNITLLIDTINSNTGPFESYKDPLYTAHLNYFTHYNINILDNSHSENARCNLHPLTINRSALYSAYNAQLAIGNNADDNKNNQSELLIGILGSDYKSPATIITNPGKSLEFYISTQNCNIDNLYYNAVDFPNYTTIPTLQIDTSNSVNINSSNAKILAYQHNEEITKLNVEGYGYIKELFVYDHTTDKPSHLDDIYFKKTTQNFYTSNINPGIFEGNFGFNSNLTVNFNIDTSNLSSKIATINKIKTDEIDAKNIKIGITDHFYKNDEQLDIKRIDVKTILYSNHTIQSNLLLESFYTETEIKSNIESNLSNNGIINHITGISDSTRIELINDTSNALYTIDIEYYELPEVQSNLYYEFINTGSDIDLNPPVIAYCNLNIFNDLSNNFINTDSLCNITEITSNIYDILYYEGSNDTLQYYIKDSSNLKIDYEKLSNLLYNITTLDEDCNITSNIISNINILGFCNLYIENNYSNDTEDLTNIYTIISNNEININNKYRIHLSNIVDGNEYTAEEIINSIYENGLNPYQYTYDLESNFKYNLQLEIYDSNEILDKYSNTLITEGFNNITENYIKNFDNFKHDLNDKLITLKDNIPSSNLLSFDTCVSKIEDHININKHSKLTSNLVYILDQFEYKIPKDQAVNRQLLNFVTNYDTSNIENDKQILIYSVNDGLTVNTDNNNVSIPNGLFSIGTDTTDGAMLSINNCNNNPEIVISEEDYKVQIGHNITNKETFTIKTNNIQDHNIELNAGAYGPNLFLKANTTNVGINTRNPTKALDVNGDIISTNYYKRYLGEPKLIANFLDYKDHIKLEKKKRLLIESPVKITNKLTINKIFKGDNELFNFNKKTYNNQHYLHSEVGCIFMGEDVNKNIDNTAMLLQNTLNIEKNNTIIRLLKATKWTQGDNPDPYTGIEFTRYPNNPYTGWYIHNKHNPDNFEIGYRNNENNAFNLIKTSYSSGTDGINDIEIGDGNGDNKIILNNNVEVKGDIDVIGGTYRLNGAVFSSNNIDLSTILSNASILNDPSFPNIVQPNDISMSSASRIINLVAPRSSMFIGTYHSTNYDENDAENQPGFTNYLSNYSIQHKLKKDKPETTKQFDANVNIVMPVDNSIENDKQPPLLALKATHNLHNFDANKNVKSGIRLAILDSGTTTDYWDNKNYADLYYKYFSNKSEFGIDFKYKNGDKNTPFKITEKNDEIYTTLSSVNNTDDSNAFFHILDDKKNSLLLLETRDNESINIKLKTQDSEWNIDTDEKFKITHNDKYLTFTDNGLGINVKDPLASLDISNSNIYGITIKNNIKTNDNTKTYHIDTDQIIVQEPITDTNSITFNLNKTTTNHTTSNIKTSSNISITQTFYNCNFTGNDDINTTQEYSNIYDVSIDNHTNESKFILNINIDLEYLNNYLSNEYSILSNVNLDSNIYEASNEDHPNAIVKVATIYDLNNLIISNISTSNYEIYLNGIDELPKLLSNYTICNIDFAVYHPENCNYDFKADVNLVTNYTITTNIISGIHSALEINQQGNDIYEINFLNEEYRSNVESIIISNINKTDTIDSIEHTYNFDPITLQYYTIDKTCNVSIDIIEPQSHIKLTTDQDTKSYYITGHNSNFNINYQDDTTLKEILNITNESKLTIDTLFVKNIECTGKFHNYESLIFCNENFNSINIKSDHLYINTESAYSILINTDAFDDKNTYTSVIFGNKANLSYSNIIALQSSSTNSYLNITTNGQSDNYKIGKTDNNFNIIHTDSNILSIKPEYDEFKYSNYDFDDDSDNDGDGTLTLNEIEQTPDIKTITTQYDYVFTEGRLKGIKNINYTSNVIFTEQTTPIMSLNQDDITMHQRLICALGTTTSSDRRIKDNINIIENALDKIDRLDGVSYFNKLSKSNEIGLIAQDVKEVIPEVVVDSDIMGIQYGNMIGLLIEGIKELRKEIRNGSNSKC